MNVLNALRAAEHELIALTGLRATDRPDLPLTEETSFTLDPKEVLAQVQAAIRQLSGSESEA